MICKFKTYLKSHPQILLLILCGFISFEVCCFFGIQRFLIEKKQWLMILAIIYAIGIIGLEFKQVLGMNKVKDVFIMSLLSTVLGMVLRFFIEFGEYSNTVNFVMPNIIGYLIIVPSIISISYKFIRTPKH